jgi:hypothetical protein
MKAVSRPDGADDPTKRTNKLLKIQHYSKGFLGKN